ncbi:XRE family transcriptional regulator [Cryobacterium sp. TmT2-59]|uniref:helix-turn-helix domain-containing protein n=1 Tax=Cryobacterium sp. TmT2-59 TaxID=1259264 RepID=UPI001069C376|nr:helix-turn-helix transcriptional regulator [Cryobacterium sp. TmT2-59]TFC85800.1 XRE family transcriptional regulator [Cryobacterium sp. TmT2-59]
MFERTTVTTTTDRGWNAQAWIEAHPNWADEPVSAIIRAGFTAQELDGLFDRLKPAHALAVLRESAGLTVEDVADLAGISPNYLARIENGDTQPTPALAGHVSAVIARDLSGAAVPIVATAAGFIVQPDSLLMKSLCNADNGSSVDRGRYLINDGAAL